MKTFAVSDRSDEILSCDIFELFPNSQSISVTIGRLRGALHSVFTFKITAAKLLVIGEKSIPRKIDAIKPRERAFFFTETVWSAKIEK